MLLLGYDFLFLLQSGPDSSSGSTLDFKAKGNKFKPLLMQYLYFAFFLDASFLKKTIAWLDAIGLRDRRFQVS